jgi:FkbM family methyltransferase
MLIDLQTLVKKYDMDINGIIHLGAHIGQEADTYNKCGVSNVVWIEANPKIINTLISNVSKYKHKVINACVSDTVGKQIQFNITNNEESSSILELGTHEHHHKHIHVSETLNMKTTTLKNIYKEYNLNPKEFNLLNIDIQGAELLALKGLEEYLCNFEYLYLEVNQEHLYKECALVTELDDYLEKFGFFRVETEMTQYNWGDAVYIKKQPRPTKKVITYSLWENNPKSITNIITNIKLALTYYPDWECWIYIYEPTIPKTFIDEFNTYSNVKTILKSGNRIFPNRFMLWCFEAADDPTVTHFLSRSGESCISPKEVMAVQNWVESGKTLLIMRDKPHHTQKIVGGFFGLKCEFIHNAKSVNTWNEEVNLFYKYAHENIDYQVFLANGIYSRYKNDAMIYDEIIKYEDYICRPFPIPNNSDFENIMNIIRNTLKNIFIIGRNLTLQHTLLDKFIPTKTIDTKLSLETIKDKYTPTDNPKTIDEACIQIILSEIINTCTQVSLIVFDHNAFSTAFVQSLHDTIKSLPTIWENRLFDNGCILLNTKSV